MNVGPLLGPPLMFLPLLCSHINQKTQFENPVMEAKKKLSAETLTGAPGPAATPAGNGRNGRDVVTDADILKMPDVRLLPVVPAASFLSSPDQHTSFDNHTKKDHISIPTSICISDISVWLCLCSLRMAAPLCTIASGLGRLPHARPAPSQPY